MSVKIRLHRAGAKHRPFYRVVVADSRKARDGRFIEMLGYYDPLPETTVLSIDAERMQQWIAKGATPSGTVATLLKKLGKLPSADGVATAARDRRSAMVAEANQMAPQRPRADERPKSEPRGEARPAPRGKDVKAKDRPVAEAPGETAPASEPAAGPSTGAEGETSSPGAGA